VAEILIACIAGSALFTLTLYLIMCIHDRRNPIKFWHTHKWQEVYKDLLEGRRKSDPYGNPVYKSIVIINQCTICKRTRKTEDKVF